MSLKFPYACSILVFANFSMFFCDYTNCIIPIFKILTQERAGQSPAQKFSMLLHKNFAFLINALIKSRYRLNSPCKHSKVWR